MDLTEQLTKQLMKVDHLIKKWFQAFGANKQMVFEALETLGAMTFNNIK